MSLICTPCQIEFPSKEALTMHTLAKHSVQMEGLSKEERKQAREEVKQEHHQKKVWIKRSKQVALYGLVGVTIIFLVYWIVSIAKTPGAYSDGQVHWHADLKLNICGQTIPLPKPKAGTSVHGEPFVGTPFMHLHDEPSIHIEGTVRSAEEITLGKFMEVIGLNFKDEELLNKKNGDPCPNGNSGRVTLMVNGRESPELTNKVIVDGEDYELRFE